MYARQSFTYFGIWTLTPILGQKIFGENTLQQILKSLQAHQVAEKLILSTTLFDDEQKYENITEF